MIVVSSLNDQYGYSSFCISAFLDGQPQSMNSANVLRCSSSGMSVHESCIFILMCMPSISFSLFVLWDFLDGQSAVNSCSPGLYIIMMLYWCIHSSILLKPL